MQDTRFGLSQEVAAGGIHDQLGGPRAVVFAPMPKGDPGVSPRYIPPSAVGLPGLSSHYEHNRERRRVNKNRGGRSKRELPG